MTSEFKVGNEVRAIRNGTMGFNYHTGDVGVVVSFESDSVDVKIGDFILKGASPHNWESLERKKTEMNVCIKEIKREVYETLKWENMTERFKDIKVVMLNGNLNKFELFGYILWEDDIRALNKVFSDIVTYIENKRIGVDETEIDNKKEKPKRRIETDAKD